MRKSLISSILYFLGIIILIIVIIVIAASLKGLWDNFNETEEQGRVIKKIESDVPAKTDTSIPTTSETDNPAVNAPPSNPNEVVVPSHTATADELKDAVIYEGDLELPVNGATGYASVDINLTALPNNSSEVVKVLPAGTAFLILNEDGDWWEVSVYSVTGWVRHNFCMINLPDVIPSIIYNSTNTYSSLFVSSGESIPNVTGEALYFGKTYNERLKKEEFIVPVLYSMSKRIYLAQKYALENGDSLAIYEGYRPYSVQKKVATELTALANARPEIKRGISTSPWYIDWFIATGVSNHQRGYAIDTSLVKVLVSNDEAVSGKYKYKQITTYFIYSMPTQIHELSMAAITFTRPVTIESHSAWKSATLSDSMKANEAAQNLQKYCTDAGLTPLASEWWHFNDLYTLNSIIKYSNGNYELTDCYSVAP